MNSIIISTNEKELVLYQNMLEICKVFKLKQKSKDHSSIEIFLNQNKKEKEIVLFNIAGFISDFKIFQLIYEFLYKKYEDGNVFLDKFYNSFYEAYKTFIAYCHDITFVLLKNYLNDNNNEIKLEYFLKYNLKNIEDDLYVILNNPKSVSSVFKKFQKELMKDNTMFFTALKNIKKHIETFESINTLYFEPQENSIVAMDEMGDYLFFDDFFDLCEDEEILDFNNLTPYHYIITLTVLAEPNSVVLYTSFNKEFLKNFFKFVDTNKKYIGSLCGKIEFGTQNI